ncbi:synaptopodin 2-like protein [Synchiropus picturatus]
MVAEEIVVSLSGGPPWGFRLQGGSEQQKPLQVAKVRRRSKACRAGLKEHDQLVAIDDHPCGELSHAQAMNLIDAQTTTLILKVQRTPSGFHPSHFSSSLLRVLSPTTVVHPNGITSPPDSEAYYGETDSDADTQSHTYRHQRRRTSPNARSPSRYDNQEEDTSEMSGYESANDNGLSSLGSWTQGVPRREFLYDTLKTEWTTPAHTPHTLTPRTLTPPPDQGLVEAEGEGDSGFQEAGVSVVCPPLVSPERAKEALMLGSGKQLVPMVGPQQSPKNDELSTTYMDKARQAKLHRSESVVEKQVKEARTKCRSIASLLTDAPNPNSKGVLMFKKRRQRAKKYTLTCFGKADGDRGGDTGGETEEEGGSSVLSGSEVEEEGFSSSFDATWDSGYLDLLDSRSSACPSTTPTTPTTPTTNHSPGLETPSYQTLGLVISDHQSPALDGSGLESSNTRQPAAPQIAPKPEYKPPQALTNGASAPVSRTNMTLSPSSQAPMENSNLNSGQNPRINLHTDHNNATVLNRTARPFTPGPSPARTSITSVMFRPPQPKPVAAIPASQSVAAVSMMSLTPAQHPSGADSRRVVSSTSLYIPQRNNNCNSHPCADSPNPSMPHAPPSTPLSPSASLASSFNQSLAQPFSPPPSQPFHSPSVPFNPAQPTPFSASPNSAQLPAKSVQGTLPFNHTSPHLPTASVQSTPSQISSVTAATPIPMTQFQLSSPQSVSGDSMATREQRISVPASRTGILQEARHRGNKKPMFSTVQIRDTSPNPALLSMVQNMDDRFTRASVIESGAGANNEAGHESGPEEDWLRLGAEACNFMQAQRGPKPPPVAPKPQAPQLPQLAGKGGQLFARRQSRMDRYVVERSPSVAAAPYSPAQTREPSPTPSLPATWKYSSNIRAPPPISYNPLLSPSCPPKAQKKTEVTKERTAGPKGHKAPTKPVDIMNHQPYKLNSSLFSYGCGASQDNSTYQQRADSVAPQKTARVYEIKRFSTPPPTTKGPDLKVIIPRSATTLGEPMWRSDIASPTAMFESAPITSSCSYAEAPNSSYQSQWATPLFSPPPPPAPTAPLPQLPSFTAPSNNQQQTNKQFKSAPNLSPLGQPSVPQQDLSTTQLARGPRPRFSASNLGLQASVWRPGSTIH